MEIVKEEKLIERECDNGHRYFAEKGEICPDCGLELNWQTGEEAIFPEAN